MFQLALGSIHMFLHLLSSIPSLSSIPLHRHPWVSTHLLNFALVEGKLMISPLRGYSMFANPLMSPHHFSPTTGALKRDFPSLPNIENSPTTGVPKHELPVPPKIEDSPTTMCRRNSTPTHGGRRLPPPTSRRVAALPTFRRGAFLLTSCRGVSPPTFRRRAPPPTSVEETMWILEPHWFCTGPSPVMSPRFAFPGVTEVR